MPRRNLLLLLAIGIVALLCYQKVQTNQYGQILANSAELIQRLALEKVEPETLFEGAMEGMVGRLDVYSSYIPPKDWAEFQESLDQQFSGVGMEVTIDPKTRQMTVISPFVGAPAYEAGVRAGDKILRIGELSTQGMSIKDAVSLMRGKPGDPVTVTVLHLGEDKPVDIKIVRAIIPADTVWGDTRNADGSWNYFLADTDRIGYLRINSFGEKTGLDLKRALQWLVDHEMRGLILDLRDNPGGSFPAALEVCDMFITSGTIVTTRGRDGRILELRQATGRGPYTKFPLVVLVNQYSASASEVVAACLQDHDRATIVGQRSWGKGTVQQVIELGERHGALKLTTASYWRPNNQNIHRRREAGENESWGVSPDPGYEVAVEGDELTRLRLWRMHRDLSQGANDVTQPRGEANSIDRQLAKAVECLESRE